jgi:diguanylate cyclase (GGDEF)-like protein/PAS domain S-box-containing protein
VLLLDEEGKRLYEGAAPRLPRFYNEAVNGIEIGKGVDSCGMAAFLAERVIVEEIATHEYWQPYTELAAKAGLAACWSEPILGSNGKVLGTFAIYHKKPSAPSAENIQLIMFAANLAAIAIENSNTREALVQQERKFRTLAENAPINILRFDHNGRIAYINSRFSSVLGVSANSILGSQLSDVPNMKVLLHAVEKTIASGEEQVFEIELPEVDDELATHLISMVPETDAEGNSVGVLATGLDISERKRLERELEYQANVDFLTGLVNRRHFIEVAEKELIRFERYHGGLSIILFDIDLFKQINDAHGHSVGDLVLKELARVSLESVREIDVVARFGGEEFVVLLPHTSQQEAAEIAERLRQSIAEASVKLDNGVRVRFTASLGVITLSNTRQTHKDLLNIDQLIKRADAAMYTAKRQGRNRVFVVDEV